MIKHHTDWEGFELNLLTLSFSKAVEKDYKEQQFTKTLRHVRVAMLTAIGFFGIFGILDAWIVPEVKYKLWYIRYGIFCPFVLLMFIFSFSDKFKAYMQICIAAIVALAGFGIVAMIMLAPYQSNNSYYTGLILVFFFGYTFFKLDFIYAAATGILIVAAYEIAAIWWSQTPLPILINNNFFFLAGNLIGMVACYSIELSTRKEYIQAKLLESEQRKVHKANLELEHKVEERTGQLLRANKVLKQEIAERNRAEEHVRESESKYRSILESMQEGYYELDITGNLTFCNDAFTKIVGYERNELLGANYRQYTRAKDAGKVFRAFNNVYVSHKPSKDFEWQIVRKDGEKRFLEASVSLTTNSERLPNGFKGVVRDVTDRNLAEESLKEAYSELKRTQSQLVQSGKLASIGELAAGVAHELNQPLMIIRGHAQLTQRNIAKGKIDIGAVSKQLEPIERNTKRMMNIIDHLRTFSRQSKAEFQPVDINQAIEDSFLMIGEQLRLRNIRVEKNLDVHLPTIKGETNQLEQVFLNLITNARDAITGRAQDTPPEEDREDFITITTQMSAANNQRVEILFTDSGGGITEEDRGNIFDPFFTTKEVGKGTGLGLSISYGIISDHGGEIEIARTGPEGTTFLVSLPVAKSASKDTRVEDLDIRQTA
ncbi:MAG: PAS domain S-box protein [Desulfobacterales bacterium]|nr:PAS domain S-box protein [Desulfobacterales bacterium]MDJ0874590.1 PAS domain S-box protein [Desulfobacterales bacterium]